MSDFGRTTDMVEDSDLFGSLGLRLIVQNKFRWFFNSFVFNNSTRWGHSSVGRAPDLHSGGRRFDPVWLHHSSKICGPDGTDESPPFFHYGPIAQLVRASC